MSAEAQAAYLATEAARRSAHVSLVAEIANAYLAWVVDSQLLELARQTEETRQQTVNLVERQYQVGIATQLDLSQAKGALHDARANTAEFDRLVEQDRNALQLLTGLSEPLKLSAAPADLRSVVTLAGVPNQLPSNVLLSRPDIIAAEYQIQAANGNIGAARAAFFPRIVLTAGGGTATDLSGLFSGGSGAWNFYHARICRFSISETGKVNLDLAMYDGISVSTNTNGLSRRASAKWLTPWWRAVVSCNNCRHRKTW